MQQEFLVSASKYFITNLTIGICKTVIIDLFHLNLKKTTRYNLTHDTLNAFLQIHLILQVSVKKSTTS